MGSDTAAGSVPKIEHAALQTLAKSWTFGRWFAPDPDVVVVMPCGFDVQRTIPYGTPDDVRREVRFLMDAYRREDGRFMLTLGNGATPDTPLASLEALLDEALRYGRFPGT